MSCDSVPTCLGQFRLLKGRHETDVFGGLVNNEGGPVERVLPRLERKTTMNNDAMEEKEVKKCRKTTILGELTGFLFSFSTLLKGERNSQL